MKPSEFDQPTYRPVRLSRGQSLHVPVRPGTAVQVLRGSLQVNESIRWIAETALRPARRVDEGEWLFLEDGGWLEVEAAVGEAQLMLVEPAEPMAWLWRRLRALLRGTPLAGQRA